MWGRPMAGARVGRIARSGRSGVSQAVWRGSDRTVGYVLGVRSDMAAAPVGVDRVSYKEAPLLRPLREILFGLLIVRALELAPHKAPPHVQADIAC